MAQTRRRRSKNFGRSDAQDGGDAAAAAISHSQAPHTNGQQPRTKGSTHRPNAWLKPITFVRPPGERTPAQTTHRGAVTPSGPPGQQNHAPVVAAQSNPAFWPDDIVIEILSVLWNADVSPRERRRYLATISLVCKHWYHMFARIVAATTLVISPRSDIFKALHLKDVVGIPSCPRGITRTYIRQMVTSKSKATSRQIDVSRHLALVYENTGNGAFRRGKAAKSHGLPASTLRDAIDTFRHLDYMPNLRLLVMEYRTHLDTDPAPLHRATFRVVHLAVEYHFPPQPQPQLVHPTNASSPGTPNPNPTPHWLAEELGLLPTSVSRKTKREMMLATLPDLDLVSFASGRAPTSASGSDVGDDPSVLRDIGDMLSMGAGNLPPSSSSSRSPKTDDGRSIHVKVLGGLQGLEGTRFALVHGALDKETCVVDPPQTSVPPPLPRRRRQSMSFLPTSQGALPSLPNVVKGTALALVINLGRDESRSGEEGERDLLGQREARILMKRSL